MGVLVGSGAVSAASPNLPAIHFDQDIRPILSENCFQCHGFDSEQRRAELRLDTEEGMRVLLPSGTVAVVSGDVERSELWRRINHEDAEERMPPLDSGRSLKPDELERIRRWIEDGATYSKHWAFEDPVRPGLPSVRNATWGSNAIDRFVLARLEAMGLETSPEAALRVLVRRLSFDLRGLPPTPDEVAAFLADERDGAYLRLVDRWLASPRYGERMAQDWLDAARYADTTGHAADAPRTMWLYRDWVIDAFNRNQPFDQFTIEQLAGDMIPGANRGQKIATGFHRNSMQALGNNPRKEEYRVKGIVDRIDTTGRVWLGLTLACAECHDHKYDPLSTQEYYSLYSIFNNVPHLGERFDVHGPRMQVMLEREQRLWDLEQTVIDRAREALGTLDETGIAQRQARWEANPSGRFEVVKRLAYRLPMDEGDWVAESPWGEGSSRRLNPSAGGVLVPEWPQVTGEWTVSLWVKTRSSEADLVSNYDWKAGQRSFVLGIGGQGSEGNYSPGHLYAWISSRSESFAGIELMGSQGINDGEWHHVALTFRPGKEAALWVDGRRDLRAETKGTVPDHIAASDRAVVIGGGYENSAVPNAFFYDGLVHDVRLYERAWSDMALLGGSDPEVCAAFRVRPTERTERQRELLTAFFGRVDPVQRSLRERIETAVGRQKLLSARAVTAQVMEELPKPRETFVHLRGNFENPGERVFPGTPAFLPPMPEGKLVNRLSFAEWLVDEGNPLVARVAVNRIWAHYFGQGLVTTVDDFGVRGAPPSHPRLLDWLAVELVASGWDMKALNRLIVTSATYRQASRLRPELTERDPNNRWLARGPRLRLAAEQIRDNALAVSGLLTSRIGGPSVFPRQPAGVGEFRDATAGQWVADTGGGQYRRSLYTFWQRMSPYPSLTIFDAPSRERSCVRRSRTSTPLQALALLNDPAFVAMADALARRILDAGDGWESRLEYAFQLVLARSPEPRERDRFHEFAQKQRASGHAIDRELWERIAQVLLNMDETITKE